MIIGIKYCGGCNPFYNRARRVEKFRKDNPEHEYVNSAEDTVCDYWMVVCGCGRRCADIKNLNARKKVVLLWDEESFQMLQGELRASEHEEPEKAREKRILSLYEEASMKRTITREDAECFARLTGDESRLHLEEQTAVKAGFEGPLVHGMLLDSLVSALMGTRLPGSGTVYVEHNTRFIRPVYWGDTVEITVRFVSFEEEEDHYMGLFYGTCKNQHGQRILSVSSRQRMMKTIFVVAGEKE